MNIGILGAGLSGISLAYLLQENERIDHIDLLEKAGSPGGLCRSYPFAGIGYDVGPHIMFSRNPAVLDLLVRMLGDNVHKLRRSNRIYHDGRFIKYPFENELSALSAPERDYCLNTFLNNPYAPYPAQSMLQFFLATFGEGITNLYLRPYNEKIWKFDPAFMDTQMVERIPKPPPEDIIKSAQGVSTEGYLHQLHFYYPKRGGIQSLLDGFKQKLGAKVAIHTGATVQKVSRSGQQWQVPGNGRPARTYDRLISTIPIPELIAALDPAAPPEVTHAAQNLRYNSIAICMLHVPRDRLGENFAIMVANRDILRAERRGIAEPGRSRRRAPGIHRERRPGAGTADSAAETCLRDLRSGSSPEHADLARILRRQTRPHAPRAVRRVRIHQHGRRRRKIHETVERNSRVDRRLSEIRMGDT